MATDTQNLQAGREADKLVAEALGWESIGVQGFANNHGYGLAGIALGGREVWEVPHFSTTDAALVALQSLQDVTGKPVKIFVAADIDDKKAVIIEDSCGGMERPSAAAPTLYLAICRFIVAVTGW